MRWVALLLATALLFGCASHGFGRVEPPSVQLVNVVPLEATPFEQRLRVVLRLVNPNNVDLEIDGLSFDLELNGAPFTRGVSSDGLTLPRLADATLEVVATTTLFDLLRQVQALRRDPGIQFPYAIRGRVFVTAPVRREVPFERNGSLVP